MQKTSVPPSVKRVQPILVSFPEAARMLGISRAMVYKLVEQGQLQRVHIGKSARVRVDEVYRLAGGAPDFERTA